MEDEKVKVTYGGKMYETSKKGNNYWLCTSNGTISNSEDGWILTSSDKEHPDDFFCIKYRKDGYMEYKDDMIDEPKVSDRVYDPEHSTIEQVSPFAEELYYISRQLEGYDKMGVSPIDVLELRYKTMGMVLKMLGYESVNQVLLGEPNPDVSIMDLNRTIQFIEQYPAFSQYVTKGESSGMPTIEVSIPEDFDQEAFKEEYDRAREALKTEEDYYRSRKDFFSNVRYPMIKEDFALGMKDKVSSSDWKSYSDIVKKLGKLILGFNADLLAPAEKMQVVQATSLNKMDTEHQIFLITQIPETDEALAAESYFFIKEVDNLDKKVESDLSDERIKNSTPGKLMQQFVDELQVESEDRRKGIERRDYYRNVYPYDKSRKKESSYKLKEDEDPVFGD